MFHIVCLQFVIMKVKNNISSPDIRIYGMSIQFSNISLMPIFTGSVIIIELSFVEIFIEFASTENKAPKQKIKNTNV